MPFDAGFQPESVADLIDRARAMIASPKMWCQGRLVDDRQRHCAIGALTAVVFGDGSYNHLAVHAAHCIHYDELSEHQVAQHRREIKTFLRAACYLDSAASRRGFENIMRLNDHRRSFFPMRQHKLL